MRSALGACTLTAIGILLVLAHLVVADPKPIQISASPRQGFAPVDLHLYLRIVPIETDRVLIVTADGGSYEYSEWSLDGADSRTVYATDWKQLSAGDYQILAGIGHSPQQIRATARTLVRVY